MNKKNKLSKSLKIDFKAIETQFEKNQKGKIKS